MLTILSIFQIYKISFNDLPLVHFRIGHETRPVGHIQRDGLQPAAPERLIVQRHEQTIVVQFAIATSESLNTQ